MTRRLPRKTKHGCEVVAHPSDEDGAFVAKAHGLPGCAAHGDTQEKALKHINQAVELNALSRYRCSH